MWGVGLAMCILGLWSLVSGATFREGCLLFAVILAGLGAMWIGR